MVSNMYKHIFYITAFLLCGNLGLFAQKGQKPYPQGKLLSDNWVATDALDRKLPVYDEVGDRRKDKFVGVFYYIWHGFHSNEVYDITKLIKENSENPKWGPKGKFHFWGEPEYGYFRADDPFVLRNDMQMLSNADVDFIFFDVTNGFTYLNTVKKLCEISLEMRRNGTKTPEICFTSNSKSGKVMNELYDNFYSKGLYKDLWFYWQGKPLIMGHPDDPVLRPEVKEFFNIKYSWAWTKSYEEPNHWQWLDRYPQDYGWSESRLIPEQISVSTAHHPGNPLGKSYHDGKQPPVNESYETEFTDQGLQFEEQWSRAHEVDPQIVMVTQWNEWIAQRFIGRLLEKNKPDYAGRPFAEDGSWFVDVFSKEFNRDIAPMKGGYTDNYYYQLISHIRRFKGMDKPQKYATAEIKIDGRSEDWDNVSPVFYDHRGDVMHRNYKGYDTTMVYVNNTGRNDIVESRVSYDKNNIQFMVRTDKSLTKHTDKNWMLLFIDKDKDKSTGWEGYDYVVNLKVLSDNKTTVMRWKNGEWTKCAEVEYSYRGNFMELEIPKKVLGLDTGNQCTFDFHWADNIPDLKDITFFFLNGDSAPDRRFNYRY